MLDARGKAINIQNGFTLIELIIYIALIGTVVLSFVLYTLSISDARAKAFVEQEVQANARVAMESISSTVRSATSIDIPSSTFDLDPGVLYVTTNSPSTNPTVISLNQDDGVLQITEGVNPPVSVTSDEVRVTNLVFTDLTSSGNREHVRIELTLEYIPTNDVIYKYRTDLQFAVSLRQ